MFGPDGKPLVLRSGATIIGGPKGVADFPPLDEDGIAGFLTTAEQTIQQVIALGQPLEIPCAAMPPASLAHLAQTIRALQDRIKELEDEVASLKEGEDTVASADPLPVRLDLNSLSFPMPSSEEAE
tara:strand:- start:1302 stop:1679 length:378 start_codon:yes stop_codon:yes gene_type:complete